MGRLAVDGKAGEESRCPIKLAPGPAEGFSVLAQHPHGDEAGVAGAVECLLTACPPI
jgi:hypothetical protein